MEILQFLTGDLVFFFFYMTVATSFIPLPDFPLILHLAALGVHPAWLVALVGGLGTCAAGLIDYIAVTELRKLERVEKLLQHRYYASMEGYFKRIAFLSIVLSGFLVFIPFDPFKLLAATTRYNKYKYVAAVFIGRAPRYYLTAWLGEVVSFKPGELIIAFAVFLLIPILRHLVQRRRAQARVSGVQE